MRRPLTRGLESGSLCVHGSTLGRRCPLCWHPPCSMRAVGSRGVQCKNYTLGSSHLCFPGSRANGSDRAGGQSQGTLHSESLFTVTQPILTCLSSTPSPCFPEDARSGLRAVRCPHAACTEQGDGKQETALSLNKWLPSGQGPCGRGKTQTPEKEGSQQC